MTDYTKLVKALNRLWQAQDNDLEDWVYGSQQAMHDAADAIETITAMYEKAEMDATNLTGKLAQAEAEVERLKDSNEELREKQTFIDHYGTEWMTSAKDVPTAAYEHGYADGKAEERAKMQKRNAELHAELEKWVSAAEKAGEPKRGEWKEIEDYDGDFHYQCSVCGEELYFIDGTPADNNANYCPRCGAKMEVQDEGTGSL